VTTESEFLTTASETITGVLSGSKRERTFLAKIDPEPEKNQGNKCKLCKGSHGMWNCENFKKMSVDMRWNVAKQQKLCSDAPVMDTAEKHALGAEFVD